MDGQRAAAVLLQVYELSLHCKLFLLSEMKHGSFNWTGGGDLTGTLNVSTATSSLKVEGWQFIPLLQVSQHYFIFHIRLCSAEMHC